MILFRFQNGRKINFRRGLINARDRNYLEENESSNRKKNLIKDH